MASNVVVGWMMIRVVAIEWTVTSVTVMILKANVDSTMNDSSGIEVVWQHVDAKAIVEGQVEEGKELMLKAIVAARVVVATMDDVIVVTT